MCLREYAELLEAGLHNYELIFSRIRKQVLVA